MPTLPPAAENTTPTRPDWSHRMRTERENRGWSQADLVAAMQAHARGKAATRETMVRNVKRWEAGSSYPDEFHRRLIALTFGTVTGAFFPTQRTGSTSVDVFETTGMDAHEVAARLQASDLSPTTLEAIRVTADRLCCEYAFAPAEQVSAEAREWLQRITELLNNRVSLAHHRELFSLAGTFALILGCLEHDLGDKAQAEQTRQAALLLTRDAADAHQSGWAWELLAWFSLAGHNFRAVIEAAEAGQQVAPHSQAAVQLAAQKAKAWARLGDRRQVEIALEEGRRLLEGLPTPANLDHHFAVDPRKFDFYAMDCYRVVGEHAMARLYADEVSRMCFADDGTLIHPMRLTEARLTYGVIAAREGDVEAAVAWGEDALSQARKSLPSLQLSARELVTTLETRYPKEPATQQFAARVRELTPQAAG